MHGWCRIKAGAQYMNLSERSVRALLKTGGLRHVRLPSGTVLLKYEWIDEWLEHFEVSGHGAERIVQEIESEFKKRAD